MNGAVACRGTQCNYLCYQRRCNGILYANFLQYLNIYLNISPENVANE